MELQQSPQYANYIKSLHWQVESIDGVNIFIRKFPLAGGFAKLQRIEHMPDTDKLFHLFKRYRVKRIVVEASANADEKELKTFVEILRRKVTVMNSPYIPTKTILIDLEPSEEELFQKLTEAKRRAVRRAIKNDITVTESDQINQLIKVKNKSAGLFGFITTSGAKEMWNAFRPHDATTLLAFTTHNQQLFTPVRGTTNNPPARNASHSDAGGQLLAGIFLIFCDTTAYYWIAGATKKGKKLFAPTLLAWEAIKLAKKRGMKQFDFVGIWDERFPKENKDWLGFTKFKEGFGGKEFYYPTHRTL